MGSSGGFWRRLCAGLIASLAAAAASGAAFTVKPVDLQGADGVPDAVDVESAFYKLRFILWETGSAQSMLYKPLNHELRAENYYASHNNLFRDWVRLADPDPGTGYSRRVSRLETRTQSQLPATHRIVRQDANELVLEFETRSSTAGGQAWMEKILNRRRLFIRNDTPAVRVENEIVNTDAQPRSVIFDVFNSVGLGRVKTWVSMPGPDGKVGGVDAAEERSSSFLFAPEVSDAWTGGVNEEGLGAAFSFAWPDVDAMQVCMWKTVGSSYHVIMRRREIPAGKSITFRYTFMPFTGFGAFDGMQGDLAGGLLVGKGATFMADAPPAELAPDAALPIKVFLASGKARNVAVRLRCIRKDDGKAVLDETKRAGLQVGKTATVASQLKLAGEGLYVLTVTAEGGGGRLVMEKPIEVGRTKLVYEATPPAGEKLGTRDGGHVLGPPRLDPQFKTLDPKFVTPHLPLLKKHAMGAVPALFLTPADSTLGHVREICQRAEIAAETCAITKIRLPKGSLHSLELAEFRKQLRASQAKVLVSLGIDWHAGLQRKLTREILERVREGLGVVAAVRDLKKQPELEAALAEAKEVQEPPLPPVAVQAVPVRRFQLGKGRIVLLVCNWSDYRDAGKKVIEGWTTVRAGERAVEVSELRWRGFEYSYARLGQVIRWAAAMESPITLTAARIDDNLLTATLHYAGEKATRVRIDPRVRTRRWEVRTTGERSIALEPGQSDHEVLLGAIPDGGAAAIELPVRDGSGRFVAFASLGIAVDEWVKLRVAPEPEHQSAEAPGSVVVEMTGADVKGRLEVQVTDRFGRLVAQRDGEVELQGGKGRVELSLAHVKPVCVYHEALARFFVGDELVAEATGDVLLIPAKPPYADRFLPGVWGAPERRALQIQAMLKTTHGLGLTLHTHSYDDRVLYASGGWKTANLRLSAKRRYAPKGQEPKLDSKRLIMEPPLLPRPETLAAAKAEWQKLAREQFQTGARLIGIDDERRMSDDFDFHPHTLAGFREWLKGRYPDIAALNKTWGTTFADFTKVVPKRRSELGDSPNLAPWLEFRMFIGKVLGDAYMKAPAEWAAEIDPSLSVGEWGIYDPSTHWPVDWSQVAKCYKYTARYGGDQGMLEELFRCFAPGTRHGRWMGYGMRTISPGRRIAPWRTLLNGGSFCWFWEMRDPGTLNYAVLTSDQRPTAGYAALAKDEFPDLTGGIDRLILASRFVSDPIAILYSYPSWLAEGAALARDAKTIVEELGFQHDLVNAADLPKGWLGQKGTKLLIVQEASCLSPEQVAAVRAFVEAGGVLLCTGRTAWRDLHGAPHAEGSLTDPITGLKTAQAKPLGRTMQTPAGEPHLALHVAWGGVAADGAEVLASVELDGARLPVWTVHQVGKGKVYWLNADLGAHRTVKSSGVAGERSVSLAGAESVRDAHWQLFDHAAAMAGLKPRCRFFYKNRPVFGGETWYYATPSGRTLFIAHAFEREFKEGVYVRLRGKHHVYEARDHRSFSFVDYFSDTFPPGRMKIYVLGGYRVSKLSAEVEPEKCKPGDPVRVTCTVVPYERDKAEVDLHALRVQVTDSHGVVHMAADEVVLAPDGKATFELSTALNQAPGKYTIHVTDAMSGAGGRKYFYILKPE